MQMNLCELVSKTEPTRVVEGRSEITSRLKGEEGGQNFVTISDKGRGGDWPFYYYFFFFSLGN